MSDELGGKRLNRRQVLALRGLRLPSSALNSLRQSGILCEPAVTIVWHKVPDAYVIRGRESGGAVSQLGAYCGFVSESGQPLESYELTQNIGCNGFHALVMAAKFVRVQVFRYGASYELLITRHRLIPRSGKKRPLLENAILFLGVRGRVLDTAAGPHEIEFSALFDNGCGNSVCIPKKFEEAAALAIFGARCSGCKHSHLLQLGRTGTEQFIS